MNDSPMKTILSYVMIMAVVIVLAVMLFNPGTGQTVTYADIYGYFVDGKVEEFEIDATNMLTYKLYDDSNIYKFQIMNIYLFEEDLGELILQQYRDGTIKNFNYKPANVYPWYVSYLPMFIVVIIIVIVYIAFIKKSSKNGSSASSSGGAGGFGRMNSFSRARTKLGSDEKRKVLFSDVAGADEEKEELKEVVDFLKNPKRYSDLGAKIPRGVLLVGPPGTGKTLLAKAVAGESGVPFYSISGSDFVEMYVGVGASRVRDLFDTAKKTAPSIVFIDEIDAVGRHRGAGWGGGHDEREQTLNQLLVEMDGFGGNEGVIVMAATNRPDILDPALLRPGRFDRQVTVNYPDIKGREEILKVHARNKPLEDQVDLAVIAKSTAGFTGADLENLLNEAALLAARKGHHVISMTDIEESILKVILGPQKHSMVIKPEEKRKTAIHEAGHAIVSKKLKSQDPVQHISIIPSGRALGVTLQLPEEDKYSVYKTELIEQIAMLLGGRTAEELMLDDISGGASNDIQRATDIARKMVTQYGMSKELGPIVYGSGHDEVFLGRDFASTVNYSDEVAAKIDREILSIVEYAHKMARDILEENKDKLVFIADYLVSHETMDGEQFNLLMDKGATVEELEEIRRRKDERTREDNERCKRAKHEDASQSADTSDGSASEADETDDSSVDPGNS